MERTTESHAASPNVRRRQQTVPLGHSPAATRPSSTDVHYLRNGLGSNDCRPMIPFISTIFTGTVLTWEEVRGQTEQLTVRCSTGNGPCPARDGSKHGPFIELFLVYGKPVTIMVTTYFRRFCGPNGGLGVSSRTNRRSEDLARKTNHFAFVDTRAFSTHWHSKAKYVGPPAPGQQCALGTTCESGRICDAGANCRVDGCAKTHHMS